MNAADTFRQVTLDELISQSASFSQVVAQQNPSEDSPEPGIDTAKWGRQLRAVYEAMRHGGWMTLAEVAFHARCPEASASARIRELAKKGHLHEKRRAKDGGLFEYRLLPATAACASPR